MKGSLETKIGIFVVLALIAGVLSIELAGELSFFKKGYPKRIPAIKGGPIGQMDQYGN